MTAIVPSAGPAVPTSSPGFPGLPARPAGGTVPPRWRSLLARPLRRLQLALRRQRDIAHLRSLDDSRLFDLGITRAQIVTAVREGR